MLSNILHSFVSYTCFSTEILVVMVWVPPMFREIMSGAAIEVRTSVSAVGGGFRPLMGLTAADLATLEPRGETFLFSFLKGAAFLGDG